MYACSVPYYCIDTLERDWKRITQAIEPVRALRDRANHTFQVVKSRQSVQNVALLHRKKKRVESFYDSQMICHLHSVTGCLHYVTVCKHSVT